MSKIETVRRLNDSGPQLQILRGLTQLNRQMADLPAAVAGEVVKTLEPLQSLVAKARPTIVAAGKAAQASLQLQRSCQQVEAAVKLKWLHLIIVAVVAGIVSGGILIGGMSVFGGLSRPGNELQDLLARATPAEQAAIQNILRRQPPGQRREKK